MYKNLSLQEHRQQRDADYRKQGGEEGALGHDDLPFLVLDAEQGAVRSHGHGGQHHVDIGDGVVHLTETGKVENQQGNEHQTQGRHQVDGCVAEHPADRYPGDGRADDEQGGRYGDITQQHERGTDDAGWNPSRHHNQDGEV